MSRTGFALLALAVAAAWFLWPSRSAHGGVAEIERSAPSVRAL